MMHASCGRGGKNGGEGKRGGGGSEIGAGGGGDGFLAN